MTTRSRGRSSYRRAAKRPMAWYNNAVDVFSLPGLTSSTTPMLALGTLPEGYSAGMTILRLLMTIRYAATASADDVDAILATYVQQRPGIVEVPNLNADLLDYYLYTHLQAPSHAGATTSSQNFDIRSKRRLRGDRDLLLRITNTLVTAVKIGVGVRYLLTPS